MARKLVGAVFLCAVLGAVSARAQTQGYGWSSLGVLPFRGLDFIILKAPTRYILYFNKASTVPTGVNNLQGRAFSTDLVNWTLDTRDFCSTSGDMCAISTRRAGVLALPDGRFRLFLLTSGGGMGATSGAVLGSVISSDGVVWTREPGTRFAPDTSSIYEQGPFTNVFVSFVNLPDGSVRMYYVGGILPGGPGTPPWYNAPIAFFHQSVVLSALSRDDGLTWVREPGVRVNQMVHGPVNRVSSPPGSPPQNQFDGSDVSAVMVRENGRTLYRIFAPSLKDGAVSYVSEDGLEFSLEAQLPAAAGDPKAYVMPDGRIWLITNQYPDGIADVLVYGPQSLVLHNTRADVGVGPSGGPNPFRSATMELTRSSGPVTFEAIAGDNPTCANVLCTFHPEYFSFSPSGGVPPLTTTVTYVGPAGYALTDLIVHAKAADATAVGATFCMKQPLDRIDGGLFCKSAAPSLPMNRMTFETSGTTAVTKTSDILSVGGAGFPFTATASVSWLTVTPSTGTAPQTLTVRANPAGLANGTHAGTITVTAEGTIQTIAVTLSIGSALMPRALPIQVTVPGRITPVAVPKPPGL
jgi:hypothetical protein